MPNKIKKTIEDHKLFCKGNLLSITINPNIANQYFNSKQVISNKSFPDGVVVNAKTKTFTSRKHLFRKYWLKKFLLLATEGGSNFYYFFLEISKNGLLHWHGTVQVEDPDELAHWIGAIKYIDKNNIDVDSIDDEAKWFKYCAKDYSINKCYIESIITNDMHKTLTEWKKRNFK